METEIKQITNEEYTRVKAEIRRRYPFVTVSRNKQQYAYGGFHVIPRDYENGLTNEQIDKLCIFLKSSGYNDQHLTIETGEQVYGAYQGEFSGTKMKYVFFKNGSRCLMNISRK